MKDLLRLGRGETNGDNEVRRVGVNVSALLIVSIVAAIVIARFYHLGVSSTVVSLAVGGGAPAGTYLAWVGIRVAIKSGEPAADSPDDADRLAVAVSRQWEQEYIARRYDDTDWELTVAWKAADPDLMPPWEDLIDKATRGSGAQGNVRRSLWATSARGLSTSDLPLVLEQVPTGWLVVLGEPGYGKTVLMLRLVLDLAKLARQKAPGYLVPVFLSMTSWDPVEDTLEEWLGRQLAGDYPGLGAKVPGAGGMRSRIEELLASQRILPILDGLDEMPSQARRLAINRLNKAFVNSVRPLRLVMTCRTAQYRAIVNAPGQPWSPVTGAAAVELRAPDAHSIAYYLSARGNDHRWDEVVSELTDSAADSRLREALGTPLYASLAAAIYNRHHVRAGGTVPEVPEPAELRDRARFPEAADIRNHLLDEFIPAMYSKERERRERRAREEHEPVGLLRTERWLLFIAGYLTEKRHSTALEWWDLAGVAPGRLPAAVVGIVCGIATGLAAGFGTRVGVGIGIGLGIGVLIAVAIGLGTRHARQRWDPRGYYRRYVNRRRPGPGMAGGMIGAVIGGLGAGIAHRYGVGREPSLFSGLPEALAIAIIAGATTEFLGGLAGGLIGSFIAGLLAAVGLGVPAGIVNGLGVGLAAGLIVEYLGRQRPSQRLPRWEARIGILGGLVIGGVTGIIAWREEGTLPAIMIGLVLTAAAAWPFGLRHVDEALEVVPGPGQALARDASAFRRTALASGLAAGAAGFIGGAMTSIYEVGAKVSLSDIVGDGLGIGLATGVVIGLTFGFYQTASPEFRLINWWLAAQGKTPWRLKHFLEDAHKKTVLRQNGAAYEFRHVILQHRLADRLKDAKSPDIHMHRSL